MPLLLARSVLTRMLSNLFLRASGERVKHIIPQLMVLLSSLHYGVGMSQLLCA